MRKAEITRNTKETRITASLELDGRGHADIETGIGFLNHMLTLFASHGRFDLTLRCEGDTEVDGHHSAEDIGIVLGSLFKEALGDKKGIVRYGSFILPMDEALILAALDFSGRAHLSYDVPVRAKKVGDFDTELAEEFFLAFVRNADLTLHIRELAGKNTHHILEGVYKAAGRALRIATRIDPDFADEVPSTKGVL